MLAALQRLGIDTGKREQARHGSLRPFTHELGLVGRWLAERRQHRNRNTGRAARRVNREIGCIAEPLDARPVLSPVSQPLLPPLSLIGGKRTHVQASPARIVFVHPGTEVVRPEIGKRQQEIGEVAFRIDHDDRHRIDNRFLDDRNAESGLAASRHADAERVRDEIARVVEHEIVCRLLCVRVETPAEIKNA